MNGHKYTSEEDQWLKEFAPGHPFKVIHAEFNKKFGTEVTLCAIAGRAKVIGAKNGIDGRFKKGSISHNKGKKMSKEQYERCKNTMFKSGHSPHNRKPIGSVRLVDDYYMIKVKEPSTWMTRARYVYEQEHGKVADDTYIVHINGDKADDRIENLIEMKKSEIIALNAEDFFAKADCDEAKLVAIYLAKISDRIGER